jgi:penicillin-binding protein 2
MMQQRDARTPSWRLPTWRLTAFAAIVTISLIALVARIVQIQLVEGESYRARALANRIRLIPVAAPRGIIADRHGIILARSRPSFVVALIPSEVDDAESELTSLARIIHLSKASLWVRLLHHRGLHYSSFAEVAANEPYGPVVLATGLPVPAVARLSEVLADLPGIDLEVQPIRDYPQGALGSHLIGYVGAITQDEFERLKSEGYSPNDVIGKDGLEFSYDDYLRGTPGGERVVVDATGAVVSTLRLASKPAVPGDTLITNVDWRRAAHCRTGAQALRRGRGRRPLDRRYFSSCKLSELQSQRLRRRSVEARDVRFDRSVAAALRPRNCRRDADRFDVQNGNGIGRVN